MLCRLPILTPMSLKRNYAANILTVPQASGLLLPSAIQTFRQGIVFEVVLPEIQILTEQITLD